MKEAELQRMVTELCTELGLLYFHKGDSRRSDGAGFPDLVIVGTRILFRELKTTTGKPSVKQLQWAAHIQCARGDWGLWQPADWDSGLILAQLLSIRGT